MPEKRPCIICQTLPYKDKFGIVHDTLEFRSYGNYGSTVYDPIDNRTFLRVNICDKCVKELSRKGMVDEATVIPKPDKVSYKRWDYGEFSDD